MSQAQKDSHLDYCCCYIYFWEVNVYHIYSLVTIFSYQMCAKFATTQHEVGTRYKVTFIDEISICPTKIVNALLKM